MLFRIATGARILYTSKLLKPISTRAFSTSVVLNTDAPAKRYAHDAPERDFKNFPAPSLPEHAGKVRLGFIPNEWFEFLYNKTGVTGPYVLFWGSIATLLSKEMYVYWVDTLEHLVFLTLVIGIHKLAGPKISSMLDKNVTDDEKSLKKGFEDNLKQIDNQFELLEAERSLPEANKVLHEAKRENVNLQLEAAYRQRLLQVHAETKKRLDYHVAIQNSFHRVERQQMLTYILSEVNKSIVSTPDKEILQSCLVHLKSLSQKHAGTI